MPAPREVSQQIPAPQAKAGMQKPQGGGKVLVQIPGGARGGMVMDEIDTCIIVSNNNRLYTNFNVPSGPSHGVYISQNLKFVSKRECEPHTSCFDKLNKI